MKTKDVRISELVPYEFNNRNHSEQQVERIARSIKEFGFNQPIVVDEDMAVLVGHGRLLAARSLGLEVAPVLVRPGLTEQQKRAYRILDNKLQNDSTWSFDNLELELGFLEDNGFELEPWGLDELRGLFDDEDPEVEEDDFEATEQPETYINLGDLVNLGEHRFLCGDSTSAEDVGRLLDGNRPVLMVTDPPYGVEYDPSWRNEAAAKGHISYGAVSLGDVANDNRVDWGETFRLIPAQAAYIWHAGRHASEVQRSLEDSGFSIIAQVIWAKPMFAIGRGDYHWQHEPCWYAVRSGANHNWQGSRSESTLWKIERGCKEKTGHGTEKPIECMARPIRNNSSKGQLVCDPFLGSGTTLIAADQLGRTCYGMEISPKYCQVIIERYKKHCEKVGKPFECKINGVEFNGPPGN